MSLVGKSMLCPFFTTFSTQLTVLLSYFHLHLSPPNYQEHITMFSSVHFSHSVVSDSLRPHKSQHTTPPCPSPTPRVYSNSSLLSWCCHPTSSSSVIPVSCIQSFPASGSFLMSQLFATGGQSIGVSASTSVLPMNIQD